MRRTTKELYGEVPKVIFIVRAFLANYFIKASKRTVTKLQLVSMKERDDALIEDCLKAQEYWDRLKRKD